ncbi:hypothetical protein HA402_014658 [Bradysia odoriphaga]|nr:hypothetical protein HA402_014658 [Bradysia odoriphaga]
MQKQLLRSLARSGRSALLELLYNDKQSLSVAVLQNKKRYLHGGQQAITRGYSLAVAAQKTSNSDASISGEFIKIVSSDLYEPLLINHIWLRDHCPCPQCHNKVANQRMYNVFDSNLSEIKPKNVAANGSELSIIWNDDHRSDYNILSLEANQHKFYVENYIKAQKASRFLWSREDVDTMPYARVPYLDYLNDDKVKHQMIESIAKFGFGMIKDVPVSMSATETGVKRLFWLQKTFYGDGMWSLNNFEKGVSSDIAYGNLHIAAHTDNSSQSEPSGLICFHNTIHTGTGGESLLMDGFNIVENLRKNHPDTLKRLSTVNMKQQYVKDGQMHFHTAPIIGLDPISGLPEIIRFNLYDRSPMSALPQSEMGQYYKDMEILISEIKSPKNEWWFKMKPGELYIFDNWRLFHGRTSFTGDREMTGCFIDRSEYLNVARNHNVIV